MLSTKDDKITISLTAVGYPAPVCKFKNTTIKCEGESVELTFEDFNETLTARNSAGLEKSCPRFTETGKATNLSCSIIRTLCENAQCNM